MQSIQREHQSIQSTKSREPLTEIDNQTDTMASKQTRALTKAKEIQAADTPLVHRLKNIKNAKVHEFSWKKLWTKIQEWAFVDK